LVAIHHVVSNDARGIHAQALTKERYGIMISINEFYGSEDHAGSHSSPGIFVN
jgi:hypothetical protein